MHSGSLHRYRHIPRRTPVDGTRRRRTGYDQEGRPDPRRRPVHYSWLLNDGFIIGEQLNPGAPWQIRSGVHRGGPPDHLDVAGDPRGAVAVELNCAISERPVPIIGDVPVPHPLTGLMGMSALGPGPEHGPDPMAGIRERPTGSTVAVIRGPAPDDRAELPDYLARGGLLVRAQIGLDAARMRQHLAFSGRASKVPRQRLTSKPRE